MSEIKDKKLNTDNNNNNNTDIKKNDEIIYNIKNEILDTTTILPTTIKYHSSLLPDAIFLTTSNGQLITTSTINPVPATLTELPVKSNTTSVDENKIEMKSEGKEKKEIDVCAPANLKPSAKRKSSANTSSSILTSTTIKSNSIKKKETTLLAANFPFLTATGLSPNLTPIGFSSQNNFTSGFAPITTFSLQNPLLTPSLTIPIYNSLVAVAGTHKDIIVPNINKDLFVSAQPVSTKKQSNKTKQNSGNISQNGNAMTTSRGRKRTAQSRLPAKLKEPAAVARRNARERRRVKMVNDGFLRLRRHVPTDPKNKKLSKVKTLRLAIEYIHHLQQLLQSDSNVKHSTAAQLVSSFAHVATYEDLDGTNGGWLHSESLGRVSREMDEDIFQTIDPARLRTTSYTEFVTR